MSTVYLRYLKYSYDPTEIITATTSKHQAFSPLSEITTTKSYRLHPEIYRNKQRVDEYIDGLLKVRWRINASNVWIVDSEFDY